MRSKILLILFLVLAMVLGVGFYVSCGGGGGDDDDDSGGGGGGGRTIEAQVSDFPTYQPVGGALVEVVDNNTGLPVDPPIKVTSPANGKVVVTIPEELGDYVGIKTSKSGYKDTYQYNFKVGSKDEDFLIVSEATVSLVAALLEVELDPTKGHAAGGVYWGDPTDENPIGCAEVTTDPPNPGNIHYMGLDDLPTLDRDIDEPGNPKDGEGTNPKNGHFVSVNMEPGEIKITANADGAEESVTLPALFADSICIVNVYYSKDKYDSNPTGDWCTK